MKIAEKAGLFGVMAVVLCVGGCGGGESGDGSGKKEGLSGEKKGSGKLVKVGQGIKVFDGKGLEGWAFDDTARPMGWKVGKAIVDPSDDKNLKHEPGGEALVNETGQMQNPYTKRKFGDVRVEFEVLVPLNSNSGVYFMGTHELQLARDESADEMNPGNMDYGAISQVAAPRVWATNGAGRWDKFEVVYRAPRFGEDGKRVKKGRFEKVVLNGKVIHENVDLDDVTWGGLTSEEVAEGPLYLQGNEGAVAFRNIFVTPLKD